MPRDGRRPRMDCETITGAFLKDRDHVFFLGGFNSYCCMYTVHCTGGRWGDNLQPICRTVPCCRSRGFQISPKSCQHKCHKLPWTSSWSTIIVINFIVIAKFQFNCNHTLAKPHPWHLRRNNLYLFSKFQFDCHHLDQWSYLQENLTLGICGGRETAVWQQENLL